MTLKVLQEGVDTAGGFLVPTDERADRLVSKTAADYTAAAERNYCADCVSWRPPSGCSRVEGTISPRGGCRLFARARKGWDMLGTISLYRAYSESEARDDRGRWTSGGAGGGSDEPSTPTTARQHRRIPAPAVVGEVPEGAARLDRAHLMQLPTGDEFRDGVRDATDPVNRTHYHGQTTGYHVERIRAGGRYRFELSNREGNHIATHVPEQGTPTSEHPQILDRLAGYALAHRGGRVAGHIPQPGHVLEAPGRNAGVTPPPSPTPPPPQPPPTPAERTRYTAADFQLNQHVQTYSRHRDQRSGATSMREAEDGHVVRIHPNGGVTVQLSSNRTQVDFTPGNLQGGFLRPHPQSSTPPPPPTPAPTPGPAIPAFTSVGNQPSGTVRLSDQQLADIPHISDNVWERGIPDPHDGTHVVYAGTRGNYTLHMYGSQHDRLHFQVMRNGNPTPVASYATSGPISRAARLEVEGHLGDYAAHHYGHGANLPSHIPLADRVLAARPAGYAPPPSRVTPPPPPPPPATTQRVGPVPPPTTPDPELNRADPLSREFNATATVSHVQATRSQAAARAMFGRELTDHEWAGLTGAPSGATVTVSSRSADHISLDVNHHGYGIRATREYTLGANGKVTVYNAIFRASERAPRGIGTRMFASQVHMATKLGVAQIGVTAAGSGSELANGGSWNGYYTWPRLGYEAPIPRVNAVRPASLAGLTMMSQLMTTQEGRDWWKRHGEGLSLKFDLTPDSLCHRALARYLTESNITMVRAAKAGSDSEYFEDVTLVPGDDALLDRIWDELGEETSPADELDDDEDQPAAKGWALVSGAAVYRAFDPEQPRDDSGKWTSGGGGGGSGPKAEEDPSARPPTPGPTRVGEVARGPVLLTPEHLARLTGPQFQIDDEWGPGVKDPDDPNLLSYAGHTGYTLNRVRSGGKFRFELVDRAGTHIATYTAPPGAKATDHDEAMAKLAGYALARNSGLEAAIPTDVPLVGRVLTERATPPPPPVIVPPPPPPPGPTPPPPPVDRNAVPAMPDRPRVGETPSGAVRLDAADLDALPAEQASRWSRGVTNAQNPDRTDFTNGPYSIRRYGRGIGGARPTSYRYDLYDNGQTGTHLATFVSYGAHPSAKVILDKLATYSDFHDRGAIPGHIPALGQKLTAVPPPAPPPTPGPPALLVPTAEPGDLDHAGRPLTGRGARSLFGPMLTEMQRHTDHVTRLRESTGPLNLALQAYADAHALGTSSPPATQAERAANEATKRQRDAILVQLRDALEGQEAHRKSMATRARLLLKAPEPTRILAHPVSGTLNRVNLDHGLSLFGELMSKRQGALADPTINVMGIARNARAHYKVALRTIALAPSDSAKTVAHEAGHWLEHHDPIAHANCLAFLQRRTAGWPLERLSDLTGVSSYDASERAWKDHFFDAYVGKNYHGGASEILSMGVQELVTDPIGFAAKDPDHFDCAFASMRGVVYAPANPPTFPPYVPRPAPPTTRRRTRGWDMIGGAAVYLAQMFDSA